MKLLYLTNVRIPTTRAQGYAIMKMCAEFSRFGAEVELYIPNRRDIDRLGEPFNYYHLEKNFTIKTIPNPDLLSRTFKWGRILYWLDIICFLLVAKLMIKPKSDEIIYTRDYLTLLLFSKKNFICFEVHDLPNSRFIFRFVLKKPKLFVVLNNYLKQELMGLGVAEDKIIIAPSGIDLEDFTNLPAKSNAREKLNLPSSSPIVLYSGQFYGWKGVDILAQTAALIPEIIFIFVGGMDPELSDFKNRYRSSKNIIIKEFMPRTTALDYLAAADILVLPNSAKAKISNLYTSPLKLFEYMAARRPIVASDLPSLREVLNEKNSRLVPADDPKSLAQAISQLLADQALAERLASQAYQDVKQYTWQNRAKTILDQIAMKGQHV